MKLYNGSLLSSLFTLSSDNPKLSFSCMFPSVKISRSFRLTFLWVMSCCNWQHSRKSLWSLSGGVNHGVNYSKSTAFGLLTHTYLYSSKSLSRLQVEARTPSHTPSLPLVPTKAMIIMLNRGIYKSSWPSKKSCIHVKVDLLNFAKEEINRSSPSPFIRTWTHGIDIWLLA